MAKKAAAKKAAPAKKAASKKKAAPKPPPAPSFDASGRVRSPSGASCDWLYQAKKGGGHLEAASPGPISFRAVFPGVLGEVSASLDGEPVGAKVEGAVLVVRCGPGALLLDVEYAVPDGSPQLDYWSP